MFRRVRSVTFLLALLTGAVSHRGAAAPSATAAASPAAPVLAGRAL